MRGGGLLPRVQYRHSHIVMNQRRFFFTPLKKRERCVLVFGYCTWGLSVWKRAFHFTDGRADACCGRFLFLTRPDYIVCRRCGT